MTSPVNPDKSCVVDNVPADQLLINTIAKVDQVALGVAVGSLLGATIFLFTNLLIMRNSRVLGSYFLLLNQYFFGYKLTFAGSCIGLIYGFILGFIAGWFIAFIRNFIIKIYIHIAKYKERMISVNNFIDYP